MSDSDHGECPVCEDWMLEDDLVEEITSIRLKGTQMDYQSAIVENVTLHAACFMDLIKIDDVRGGKLSRTKIMEGKVKRKQDEDGEYYLEVNG